MRMRRPVVCAAVGFTTAAVVPALAHMPFWAGFAWGLCCGAGALDLSIPRARPKDSE